MGDLLVVGLIAAGLVGAVVDGLRQRWTCGLVMLGISTIVMVASAFPSGNAPGAGMAILVMPIFAAGALVPYIIVRGIVRGIAGLAQPSDQKRLKRLAELKVDLQNGRRPD